jgi:hypothetical protein
LLKLVGIELVVLMNLWPTLAIELTSQWTG